jgi:pimeloyl-ACP methyl ester carboxylesterase
LGAPRAGGRTNRAARALGWIAVSGEEDMPARPTNVPAPPFEQCEMPVTVPAAGSRPALTLQTRFIIASPLVPFATRRPHTLRELPPAPELDVPDDNSVILFLHGHMSGAEEALTIIPDIHRAGLARGTKFSVISVDLPNCGYSESFNHENVSIGSDELNVVKHLLIGSAGDNFRGSNIFDATRKLADLMATTPGTSLFLRSTGHSVHLERPRFLAKRIVDFLPPNRRRR